MEWVLIIVYGVALAIICLFSLGQLNLVFHYLKNQEDKESKKLDYFPTVTIQLPVYNEKYVIKRLLRDIANLDYPKDKLQVQVLDDSDDETNELIQEELEGIRQSGLEIDHIRRPERIGYKAGALDYGLNKAKGEFIAIFDADFLPKSDFLKKTLPHFSHEIGMIQSRWSHINRDYSILTRAQAFGLDAHFSVEQTGRMKAGSCINFNGTGGIWRKSCIEDAGGWQFDTLTEDLDLSYRAQLKGWKFQYLEDVDTPAELPVIPSAIKSQQYRWIKGTAETARKNLKAVLLSDLKWNHKVRAVHHLLNSSVFFFLLIASVVSIPLLFVKESEPSLRLLFNLGSVFIIGFIAIGIFYWVASKARYREKTWKYYLAHFPLFMIFSMGLSLHNSIATIEGFLGIKTPFIRTPKFNIQAKSDTWKSNIYIGRSISFTTVLEGLLAIYFAFGIAAGAYLGDYGLVLFHLMLALGFGMIFTQSVRQSIHV